MNNLNPFAIRGGSNRFSARFPFTLALSIVLMFSFLQTSSAQAPDQFSYQGVVRDLSNNLITNTTLGVQITIRQGSAAGSNLFRETHQPVTNGAGLFSIEIGTGTNLNGSLSAINWDMGPFYIQQQIDPEGGTNYTISGTTQLLSVPYALYAKNAGRAASAATADEAGSLSASGAASLTVPLGSILPYAGNAGTVPSGWLLCDGTSYDVNEYPDLFNLIGTIYGADPGRFKVPNLQGRVPVGYNVNQGEFDNLGEQGGSRTHTLTINQMPSHNHNFSDPGHDHTLNTSGNSYRYIFVNGNNTADGGFDNSPNEPNLVTPGPVPDVFNNTTGINIDAQGGNQPHNNLQPYLTINYIIKAR